MRAGVRLGLNVHHGISHISERPAFLHHPMVQVFSCEAASSERPVVDIDTVGGAANFSTGDMCSEAVAGLDATGPAAAAGV